MIGAFRPGMEEGKAENRLKADGSYARAGNPMYGGRRPLFAGIGLLWQNARLPAVPLPRNRGAEKHQEKENRT